VYFVAYTVDFLWWVSKSIGEIITRPLLLVDAADAVINNTAAPQQIMFVNMGFVSLFVSGLRFVCMLDY